MRNLIASLYAELRANGYYPDGFKKTGEINFRTALEDKTNRVLLDSIEPTPKDSRELDKLISMARKGVSKIGSVYS